MKAARELMLFGFSIAGAAGLPAQSSGRHWTVDPRVSLVWWQVDPHYSHLWSTTCPNDPSWQPGEGRDSDWHVDYKARPVLYAAGISDLRIPLFPRVAVHPVCRNVVHGEVTTADEHWSGAHGQIVIAADSFETGNRMRDGYGRDQILQTAKYPTVEFALDSLVGVQGSDTITAMAVGRFTLHGVTTVQRVPVVGWKDPSTDGWRVQGRFAMVASDLSHIYGLSELALGMAIIMHRWKTFYMGLDLILTPSAS
jgi:YceI-like protein